MNKSQSLNSAGQIAGLIGNIEIELKQVLLLTIALFFMFSPAPDSKDTADVTASFIAPLYDLDILNRKAGE